MDAFDVPDSTDWLGTPLDGIKPIEQALRCHVCKDFYNSPMITSCNHTFCSLCIRRCLSVDGKCPLCRAPDQESKLRGNWALREAADAFVKSRDAILRFAKTSQTVSTTSSPKRKAADMDAPGEDPPENKRPRMSTRSSKTRAAETTAAMMRDEADIPEPEDTAEYEPEPDDGLVACPICWARMKSWLVDKHIDTSCPGSPQPQNTLPSASRNRHGASNSGAAQAPFRTRPTPTESQPPERLPTLAYAILRDAVFRKKMADLGLSANGSRQMLERRHREWITLWNANCDSARPKRRSELLHDLEVWERTIGTRAPTMSRAANVGAQIKDKDFDGAAWATKHGSSFKDLIAMARNTRDMAHQKAPEDTLPDGDLNEAGSAQGAKQGEDATSQPALGRSKAAVVEGTVLNQHQWLDSPSKSGEGCIQATNGGIQGDMLQADPIPSYGLPGLPDGAP